MSGRMLVTASVACPEIAGGRMCQDSTGQFWYTAKDGWWVKSDGDWMEARDVSLLLPIFSYSDYETFNKIHGRNIAPTQPQKGDSVQTLDNMTVTQLRDLATRANNAAEAQEKKRGIVTGPFMQCGKLTGGYTINRGSAEISRHDGSPSSRMNVPAVRVVAREAIFNREFAEGLRAIVCAIAEEHNK